MGESKKTIINKVLKKKRLFKSEKRKEQKILYIVIGIVAVFIALFVLGIFSSSKIITKNYIIEYANLPKEFDGYKIVQLSDYHKGVYLNDNDLLIAEIRKTDADIIVLTGDFIDSSSQDIESVSDLVEKLTDIAPVLWVKGNHFYKTNETVAQKLQEAMDEMGVVSLVNECYVATIEKESIQFCGVDDPEILYSSKKLPKEYTKAASKKAMERNLLELDKSDTQDVWFKILLTHRYSIYELFPEYGYSLALAGHSHGGQLKLPWGIDLIGFDLKLFPKVKSGYNDINGMPLIVNSGLGVSNINLRLYNPPEIVVVELKNK